MKFKTRKRIIYISVGMLLFAALLIGNLVKLEIFGYEKYKDKVYSQITTTSKLCAKRGNIYDSDMNILATERTSYRIFVSTRDIRLAVKETGKNFPKIIASGLSAILDISYDSLLKKIQSTSNLDVTIKNSASEGEYDLILAFINKLSLEKMIFTEAQS